MAFLTKICPPPPLWWLAKSGCPPTNKWQNLGVVLKAYSNVFWILANDILLILAHGINDQEVSQSGNQVVSWSAGQAGGGFFLCAYSPMKEWLWGTSYFGIIIWFSAKCPVWYCQSLHLQMTQIVLLGGGGGGGGKGFFSFAPLRGKFL